MALRRGTACIQPLWTHRPFVFNSPTCEGPILENSVGLSVVTSCAQRGWKWSCRRLKTTKPQTSHPKPQTSDPRSQTVVKIRLKAHARPPAPSPKAAEKGRGYDISLGCFGHDVASTYKPAGPIEWFCGFFLEGLYRSVVLSISWRLMGLSNEL